MVLTVTGLLGAAGASVRLTSPKAGAKVSGTITVQATVKADQHVSYVILGVDEDRPQSSNSAPFTFEIDTRELTDGAHRIFVEAYDRYGLAGTSSVVTVYVRNGSPSSVQAKKPAATQVAAKPKATMPTRTASALPTSPVRSASPVAGLSRAQVASAPATAAETASVAPMISARGPVPAPTLSVAEPVIAASRPDATAMSASTPARTSVASGPIGSRPPMPQMAATAPQAVRAHTVVLNGRAVQFDVSPRIVNGRVEAGLRSLFESQGARVTWNSASRTARSVSGALTVEVPVGQQMAKVNGLPVDMGTRASIVQGRTMIPVRFFAEVVGAGLYWDGETRTALVQTSERQMAVRAPGQ
jgi:hypothetical protein